MFIIVHYSLFFAPAFKSHDCSLISTIYWHSLEVIIVHSSLLSLTSTQSHKVIVIHSSPLYLLTLSHVHYCSLFSLLFQKSWLFIHLHYLLPLSQSHDCSFVYFLPPLWQWRGCSLISTLSSLTLKWQWLFTHLHYLLPLSQGHGCSLVSFFCPHSHKDEVVHSFPLCLLPVHSSPQSTFTLTRTELSTHTAYTHIHARSWLFTNLCYLPTHTSSWLFINLFSLPPLSQGHDCSLISTIFLHFHEVMISALCPRSHLYYLLTLSQGHDCSPSLYSLPDSYKIRVIHSSPVSPYTLTRSRLFTESLLSSRLSQD